jgi:ketosteroid isomerase-like protein
MRTAMIVVAAVACAACAKSAANRTDSAAPATATVAASNGSATSMADIRRFLDSAQVRYIDAATKADVPGLSKFYTDDAIVLAPNAKSVNGRAAIDQSNTQMFATTKVTALKLTSTDVQASGDFVVETGSYDQTLTPKTGKAIHDVGKYVVVWKKQADGSYKIFREIYNTDLPAKM